MQRAFYEILDDLRAAGRTIFFSSHVLSEVERVCDRVAIIRQGRLVALEDVAALLARRKRHVEMRLSRDRPPFSMGWPVCPMSCRPTAASRASWKATSGRSWRRSPGRRSPT